MPDDPNTVDPTDPTGEAAAGTMAGQGPGTGGKPDVPKAQVAQPIQPAQDPTSPGAGATTTPQPIAPQAQPTKGATEQDILQHTYELRQKAEQAQERAQKYFAGLQGQIDKLENTGYPAMPKLEDYPKPPDVDAQKKQGAKAILGYIALAIPLALAFGSKAGRWGAMAGIGEGLKNLAAGNDEKAKESYAQWREQMEYVHRENEERMTQYKELMTVRNADIHEKLAAIRDLATTYKDQATMRVAEADDWDKMTDHLLKYEQLQEKSRTKILGRTNGIAALFARDEGEAYRSEMAQKHPELASGLYSNDPNKQGIAYQELVKRGEGWGPWWKKHRDEFKSGETAAEKREESEGLANPHVPWNPDKRDSDTDKKIDSLKGDIFGDTSDGDKKTASTKKSSGFNPDRPFDSSDQGAGGD